MLASVAGYNDLSTRHSGAGRIVDIEAFKKTFASSLPNFLVDIDLNSKV
jgi:hypothetical protein